MRESEEGSELRSGLEKGGVVVMGVNWDEGIINLYFTSGGEHGGGGDVCGKK